jgi:hypothetical protein
MADMYGVTAQEMREMVKAGKADAVTFTVLDKLSKKSGASIAVLNKQMEDGTLDVMAFTQAFIDMAKQDFSGAAIRNAKTWQTLVSNVHDAVQAYLGFMVVAPALNKLTEKLGPLFAGLLENPRLVPMLEGIGTALGDIVDDLFPKNINMETVFDWIEGKINALKLIFLANNWKLGFSDLGVPQNIIDSIDNLGKAWQNVKTFFDTNGEAIKASVMKVITAILPPGFDPFSSGSGGILGMTQWLVDNQEAIVSAVDNISNKMVHFIKVTLPILLGQSEGSEKEGSGLDKFAGQLNAVADSVIRFGEAAGKYAGSVDAYWSSLFRLISLVTGQLDL